MFNCFPTPVALGKCDTVVEELQHALDGLDIEVRYNSRANYLEIKQGADDWQYFESHLMDELQMQTIPKSYYVNLPKSKTAPKQFNEGHFKKALQIIGRQNEVDPFIADYLETLPEIQIDPADHRWIKDDALPAKSNLLCDRIFTELFGMTPTADPSARTTAEDEARWLGFCSRLIYLSAVHRAYKPGCKYDLIVAISGAQGAGKDTLFKESLPKLPNQNLFTTQLNLGADDKNKVEQIMGCVYAVSSELAGLTRLKDIDSFKSFATTSNDKVRLAYRPDTGHFPRTSIICGTTNYDRPIPNDQTGNRRWAVVKLQHNQAVMALEDWFETEITDARFANPTKRRDIIWAEAKALYELNPRDTAIAVPHSLKAVQLRKNGELANIDSQMESAWELAITAGNFGINRAESFDPETPFMLSSVAYVMGIIEKPDEVAAMPNAKQQQLKKFLEGKGYVCRRRRMTVTDDDGNELQVQKSVWFLKTVDPIDTYHIGRVTGELYFRRETKHESDAVTKDKVRQQIAKMKGNK